MFENQKYAIFNAMVVLHEVNNVPQLQGGFAAEWKFRGKRPKGRDSLELQENTHSTLRIEDGKFTDG